MDGQVKSYRDLKYWQLSMGLVTDIYKMTEKFPPKEMYGLVSQIRRAAVSIPSNIAEGYRRGARKEYRLFLTYSFGSGAELETQLEIGLNLKYITSADYQAAIEKLEQIMKMLNATIGKLTITPY